MRHASSKSRGDGVKSVEWSRGAGVQIDGIITILLKQGKKERRKAKKKGESMS